MISSKTILYSVHIYVVKSSTCGSSSLFRNSRMKRITSDIDTNSVEAEKELRDMINKMNQSRMSNALCTYGIQWNFNLLLASHFGGVWEHIRSTRQILFSLMTEQSSKVDDEALATIFCDAESILHSRPLTVTSHDPKCVLPLPLTMLVYPRGMTLQSPGIFDKPDTYARLIGNMFSVQMISSGQDGRRTTLQKWTRWQRENSTVEDVLIVDTRGNLRVCRVRTRSAVFEGPIATLCVIVEAKDSEQ